MSFVNPAFYRLKKIDKKNVEDNIEVIEESNNVEMSNIISLDEIMEEKVEIQLIDFPRLGLLTSPPSILPISFEKIGPIVVNYEKASAKNDSKSI